jgi:hypothetical protein
LDFLPSSSLAKFTERSSEHTGRNILRNAIRLALAGSVLASGMAAAQLQDHGPGDITLNFPLWYRDLDNVPLQLCRSTATSPGGAGPICFPLTPETVPPSFAGNIGDEAFYMNLNVNVPTAPGVIDLRYVAGLEAAYGTANPVGAARKGQEIVFARTRFTMHVNTTDGSCAGTYIIKHPYGTETFTDVPEGKRALFSTLDIPIGAIGDFEGVLKSHIGPFLHWDDGAGNPIAHIAVGTEQFIGDPNVEHTFTGSPFINPDDNTVQNYVEVQGPAGCNIDGTGGPNSNKLRVNTGFLMGQVYTAPIPTPTRVTGAVFSRTATSNNVVDVFATTAPGNKLILTGQGMPSVQMIEDKTAAGAGTKKYFAHLEYNGPVPPTVTVTNVSSTPVIQSESPLVDHVEATRTEYDPATHTLCVNAHSLDQLAPLPQLVLSGPDGGVFSTTPCPAPFGAAPDELDLSYSVVLPNGPGGTPPVTSPDQVGTVQSSHGGSYQGRVVTLAGAPDNLAGAPLAGDDTFTVPTGVPTDLNVGANDGAGTTIIINQPSSGTVTSPAAGTATYTPAADTPAGIQTFTYVVQDAAGKVSNLAQVTLTVNFVAQPPSTQPDNFAVQRSTAAGFRAFVLANDKAATGTTLNPATVTIVQQGSLGNATPNPDGTVTYVPGATAGSDFFLYTVASEGGASAPTRVDVSVATGAENISYNRNRFTASSGAWDLRLQENATGWFGTPLTPTAQCYLIRRNGVNLSPAQFIGSAQVSASGAIQVTATAGTATPDGGVVPGVPAGQSYTVQCATTNHVAAFPSLTNTSNTPTNSTSAN